MARPCWPCRAALDVLDGAGPSRRTRGCSSPGCLAVLGLGLARYHVDDDVRRLQALSPDAAAPAGRDQAPDRRDDRRPAPAGGGAGRRGRAAGARKRSSRSSTGWCRERAIAGYQMPAAFVPSLSRQSADRALVRRRLVEPLQAQHLAQLGLAASPPDNKRTADLTVAGAAAARAVPLAARSRRGAGHPRRGAAGPGAAGPGAGGGVRPTRRPLRRPDGGFQQPAGPPIAAGAIILTAISVALVSGLLAWRYGLRGAFWTMLPPVTAALPRPGGDLARSASPSPSSMPWGWSWSWRSASTTRSSAPRRPAGHHSVTMLAILAGDAHDIAVVRPAGPQRRPAVRAFGFTMLIGITAAYLLAPLAWRACHARCRCR